MLNLLCNNFMKYISQIIMLYTFFFFSFYFFNFTILYWFCHLSTWICHRYTHVPHPKLSSVLPPHIYSDLCQLLQKAMTPLSSTLAWKTPWAEEPSRLQSTGSWRVGHDWATSLSLFTFMHWRKKWQPTSEFLPGESQGRGSLVGCHLWGRTWGRTRLKWLSSSSMSVVFQ